MSSSQDADLIGDDFRRTIDHPSFLVIALIFSEIYIKGGGGGGVGGLDQKKLGQPVVGLHFVFQIG